MALCPTCKIFYDPALRICPKDGTPLPADTTDPNIGSMLEGKYRIDAFISSGGMGSVYRGMHVMLDKTVAIKLIRKELVTTPDIGARFQREARAASNLGHPNIASVSDFGQTGEGTLYLVMEFINGASLREIIQREGPMPPDRIVAILQPIASALARAHRHHVIHRDLKPHNIMLAVDPDGSITPKLLDFGIAKTFDDSAAQLTMTGFALGTPQYMSPEQALGKAVDGRSDIYSLGIVLYEMLTGEVPFTDASLTGVLLKQMNEAPVAPSARRPDLPISPALEQIALRCLEKDPANRFQTADELCTALEQARSSVGTTTVGATALPPSASDATVMAPRRATGTPTDVPPLPHAVTAATAPVPSSAPVPAASAAPPPPPLPPPTAPAHATSPTVQAPPRSTESAAPKKSNPLWIPLAAVAALILLAVGVRGLRQPSTSPAASVADTSQTQSTEPPPAATTPASGAPAANGGPAAPAAGAQPSAVPGAASESTSAGAGALAAPSTASSGGDVSRSAVAQSSSASAATSQSAGSGGRSASGTTSASSSSGSAAANLTTRGSGMPAGAASGASAVGASGQPAGALSQAAAAAPRAQAPAAALPENPSVFVQCSGPGEVCGPMRSAFNEAIAREHMLPASSGSRADVVLAVVVEVVEERATRDFGTTFVTRTYSAEVEGQARGAAVPMPSGRTFSFDANVGRERANENARLLAGDTLDRVRTFWDKQR